MIRPEYELNFNQTGERQGSGFQRHYNKWSSWNGQGPIKRGTGMKMKKTCTKCKQPKNEAGGTNKNYKFVCADCRPKGVSQ